jgi:CheY-like chemotaxis protein
MGGKLQCESDLNKGSYFSFSLPVTIDDRTSDNQPMPAEPLEVAGLRCLVVEYNLINREVVATLLENEGIEVVLASNGQEGVDRMQAQTFDCVLIDIQMPVMDGLEATKRIRLDERFKHIPIFALSAHASPDDVQHSLDAGMNEHITKPINPEQLLTTIARYCS